MGNLSGLKPFFKARRALHPSHSDIINLYALQGNDMKNQTEQAIDAQFVSLNGKVNAS